MNLIKLFCCNIECQLADSDTCCSLNLIPYCSIMRSKIRLHTTHQVSIFQKIILFSTFHSLTVFWDMCPFSPASPGITFGIFKQDFESQKKKEIVTFPLDCKLYHEELHMPIYTVASYLHPHGREIA